MQADLAAAYAHCEAEVRRDDPDRWIASVYWPQAVRPHAHALLAFGLEIARVCAAEILPHVNAAAAHWSRGDKAIAYLRLIFARLPRLRDSADAARLRLAEYAVGQRLPPDALMKELGFTAISFDLRRYREDEPRVPAGFGEQSGRWTDDPQFGSPQDTPARVAEDLPPEDDKDYETIHVEGETSR